MITIIAIVIACVVTWLYLRGKAEVFKAHFAKGGNLFEILTFWKGVGLFVALIIASFIQPFRLERVDAGHVGIKFNLAGSDKGVSNYEYRSGWTPINTWFAKLYEFPTYQQHIEYEEQILIVKGGFPAPVKPSFNYSLRPDAVGDMFVNLRLTLGLIEKGWLQNAILGSINNVANRWGIDSVLNYREQFELEILKEVNKHTSKWFIVSQLRTNMEPPKALAEAIIEKTKAIQAVQVAENRKLVAIADGDRMKAEAIAAAFTKIEAAKGDSAAAVINAAGRSEAIKREQLYLTPLYVDYIKANKWSGEWPATYLGGSGSNVLFNLK